jgi:hypothetical protein
MRLSRRIALLVAIGAIAGCSDSSGPPTRAIYVLETINGRPLPTVFLPIPEAPTILGGSLELDGNGHATIVEHRREMTGAEPTYITTFKYTVSGAQIHFELATPCPPAAICAAPPEGVILNRHLFLDWSNGNGDLIYDYQQGAFLE